MNVEDQLAVWQTVCRHLDGIGVASTVAALQEHKCLDFLLRNHSATMDELVSACSGNAGYMHVAMKLLADQGWLVRHGIPGSGDMSMTLTDRGRTLAAVADIYGDAVPFLSLMDNASFAVLEGDSKRQEAGDILDLWQQACSYVQQNISSRITRTLPYDTAVEVREHLDAHVLVPLMLFGAWCWNWNEVSDQPLFPDGFAQSMPKTHEAFRNLLIAGKWATCRDNQTFFTEKGRLLARMSVQYAYVLSYRDLIKGIPSLLFGNPDSVFAADSATSEKHVDRAVDIDFSGKVFSRTCSAPFLDMLLPEFDTGPLENQPRVLLDVGSGDGTLLVESCAAIRKRTLRGKHLTDHPLVLVGAEYNGIAQAKTREALSATGMPCHAIFGDIDDPEGIVKELAQLGLNMAHTLVVSKSVIHNRAFRRPEHHPASEHVDNLTDCACVDHRHRPVTAIELYNNMEDHFRCWRKHLSGHGMLVVEAHMTDSATVSQNLGRTMASLLHATHGYSRQLLIGIEDYYRAAAEAGLELERSLRIGKNGLGHDYMTFSRFRAGAGEQTTLT